jgi:hypothetical protein
MPYTKNPFAHRTNADGTKDSICKKCFMTVGATERPGSLPEIEHDHVCDPWKLEVIDIVSNKRARTNPRPPSPEAHEG